MIEVRVFDPHRVTQEEWRSFHVFRRTRATEDEPGEPMLADVEFENDLRREWPFQVIQRICAWEGDAIVGCVVIGVRRQGTPDYDTYAPFVSVGGGICQADRRRGLGTLLMGEMLKVMETNGKTRASFVIDKQEGEAFLKRFGATEKHRAVENRMRFDGLDWEMLAKWEKSIPSGSGLNWEIHAGRVSAGRLAEIIPAYSDMLADAPRGNLDEPPHRAELKRYIAWYEQLDAHGGEHLLILLTRESSVAALCEANWDARFPDRGFQALTAVARPWRGQGLAKALKAAMLRLLRERNPLIRLLITSNAEVNAPILSINTRLGFVVHRCEKTYQIDRAKLEEAFASYQ